MIALSECAFICVTALFRSFSTSLSVPRVVIVRCLNLPLFWVLFTNIPKTIACYRQGRRGRSNSPPPPAPVKRHHGTRTIQSVPLYLNPSAAPPPSVSVVSPPICRFTHPPPISLLSLSSRFLVSFYPPSLPLPAAFLVLLRCPSSPPASFRIPSLSLTDPSALLSPCASRFPSASSAMFHRSVVPALRTVCSLPFRLSYVAALSRRTGLSDRALACLLQLLNVSFAHWLSHVVSKGESRYGEYPCTEGRCTPALVRCRTPHSRSSSLCPSPDAPTGVAYTPLSYHSLFLFSSRKPSSLHVLVPSMASTAPLFFNPHLLRSFAAGGEKNRPHRTARLFPGVRLAHVALMRLVVARGAPSAKHRHIYSPGIRPERSNFSLSLPLSASSSLNFDVVQYPLFLRPTRKILPDPCPPPQYPFLPPPPTSDASLPNYPFLSPILSPVVFPPPHVDALCSSPFPSSPPSSQLSHSFPPLSHPTLPQLSLSFPHLSSFVLTLFRLSPPALSPDLFPNYPFPSTPLSPPLLTIPFLPPPLLSSLPNYLLSSPPLDFLLPATSPFLLPQLSPFLPPFPHPVPNYPFPPPPLAFSSPSHQLMPLPCTPQPVPPCGLRSTISLFLPPTVSSRSPLPPLPSLPKRIFFPSAHSPSPPQLSRISFPPPSLGLLSQLIAFAHGTRARRGNRPPSLAQLSFPCPPLPHTPNLSRFLPPILPPSPTILYSPRPAPTIPFPSHPLSVPPPSHDPPARTV
ncbi:hypothetical protein C7M84_000804 [Penaeus vannamei]|uniref:Uncharacterized protein n=1 Tax=Penaeus vannamei TaxID=6689 RepID=A0A3R7MEK5_PENVA|nr:hypothetical protein C7M84_000804 [Penaeus vannamei]